MNSYLIIKIVSVAVAAFSQILLKISANKEYDNGLKEYLNPLVIVAYGLFFGSMLLGTYSLKGITISFSTILESLSYIIIPVLSFAILKEKMNKKQLIGTLIIVTGLIVYCI